MPKNPAIRILYGEADEKTLAAEADVFEQAGYAVQRVLGRQAIEAAVRSGRYDIVVLGHTLNKDDRHHLPYMVKKANEDTAVLVLHNSGRHPGVDIALDSRAGHGAVLEALGSLTLVGAGAD